PALPPFPTRRSSDLDPGRGGHRVAGAAPGQYHGCEPVGHGGVYLSDGARWGAGSVVQDADGRPQKRDCLTFSSTVRPGSIVTVRSEEHTSELQSREN